MSSLFVYVTCKDDNEARHIAGHLLQEKLIACANIMAPHQSIYEWDRKIEDGTETAMILKTTSENFDNLKEAVCKLHSYDCPCIVALPIEKGHEPFLQWIEAQTR